MNNGRIQLSIIDDKNGKICTSEQYNFSQKPAQPPENRYKFGILEKFTTINIRDKLERPSWVFGAVGRNDIFRVIMIIVSDGKRYVFLPIIQKYVEPVSITVSDEWTSYKDLEEAGYTDLTVCHKRNFIDPPSRNVPTQTVKNL
ncbi:hypothetical protein RF11_06826 [Thelohanellus kitauei]|uniref:ISXO2-like transposase domain-containing protein n=1 Tax=Thelohanellus kitauei TaxID=669202 RepID=A0A0C2ISF8_THEKT|nr:hypothetical protein RF11_06826 [Thelohanellus kitauei]